MIYTSYFAKANKLKNVHRISISLSIPNGAVVEEKMPVFAPSWDILSRYKQNGNIEQYTADYAELLKSRKEEVKAAIKHIEELGKTHTVLLCCWEAPNKFCHRRLIVELFKKNWPEYE